MSSFFRNNESQIPSTGLSRLVWGLGSTIISQIVTAITAVLLVPLFINAWGTSGYGHWITITAFVSYLTLLDLGGQNYISNLLATEHAQGNDQQFSNILSDSLSFYIFLTCLSWLLFLIITFSPLLTSLNSNVGNTFQDKVVVATLGTLNLLAIPGGIIVSAYRGSGKLAHGMMIGNLFKIITLIVSIGILFLKFSPVVYASISLFLGIILTIVLIYKSKSELPTKISIKLNLNAIKMGASYLKGAFFFWLLTCATLINSQGVVLVLGINVPASIVALYSTQRTAAGLLYYFGGLLQSPLWPEMTFIHAQNRIFELQKVTQIAIKVIVVSTGLAALGLWILLPVIYPIWTGEQINFLPPLFLIFLVQGILYSGWMTAAWPLFASNKHHYVALFSLLNAVVTVLLSLVLVERWGIIGVGIATLLSDILFGLAVFPYFSARFLMISSGKIYLSIFLSIFLVGLFGLMLIPLTNILDGWIKVIISFSAILVFSLPILYCALGRNDYAWVVSKFLQFKKNY